MANKNPDPRSAHPKPPYPEQKQTAPGSEEQMRPRPDYGEQSYKGFGRMKDRVSLITGADSGIGRAVALAFAREGADVAVSYWKEHEDAHVTERVVKDAGRRALLLPGDLTDEQQCKKVVDETVRQFGRIDVLVNNAAYQGEAIEKFEELTPERLERTFKTNILAMFHLVRYALPHMREGSVIINTASIQAYQPSPPIIDYATTKGAIVTFTKALAQDLIERGIRVNCVAPGPVWTPLIPSSFDAKKVSHHGESSPTGRTAQPAEIAPAFVFLAADESRFVNGEILGATGGQLLA
jgi:NAD(P)-dependent dehydrogenase (short-subunit alcohol dehydrogenase family)